MSTVLACLPVLNIMSQLLNGSICIEDLFTGKIAKGKNGKHYICLEDLTDIPFNVGQKNGKHYVSLSVWINDEADDYQNNGSFSLRQSQQDREQQAKKVYVGNLKFVEAKQAASQGSRQTGKPEPKGITNDDLPF